MNRFLACGAGIAAALVLAAPCPAPIFGLFSGMEDLILDADAIVIADIGDLCVPDNLREHLARGGTGAMRPSSSGLHDQHECRILRTLKGDLAEGDALLALRWLGMPGGFERPKWTADARQLRGPCLIFLQGEPPLESSNQVGAIIPVPDGFELADLDGKTLEEAVDWIVGDIDPPEARPGTLTPEQRAERRAQRLRTIGKRDRNVCEPVFILDYSMPTAKPAPTPWPAFDYDPTNGTAEHGDVIRPRQE